MSFQCGDIIVVASVLKSVYVRVSTGVCVREKALLLLILLLILLLLILILLLLLLLLLLRT